MKRLILPASCAGGLAGVFPHPLPTGVCPSKYLSPSLCCCFPQVPRRTQGASGDRQPTPQNAQKLPILSRKNPSRRREYIFQLLNAPPKPQEGNPGELSTGPCCDVRRRRARWLGYPPSSSWPSPGPTPYLPFPRGLRLEERHCDGLHGLLAGVGVGESPGESVREVPGLRARRRHRHQGRNFPGESQSAG